MTIYYTKPAAAHMRDVLRDATVRLDEKKEESILNFLSNASYKELVENAICNNTESLSSISEHPANRNAAGWMLMHHGLCLVGGNTSEGEGGHLGGCYNGGPALVTLNGKKIANGPVPGGSRNCTRCRWFVTEPHYLPALVAHFNSVAYHFDEARNASLRKEQDIQDLKRQRMDAEDSGLPFTKLAEFRQTERIWEQSMKRFNDLAEDLVACWRLIERCKKALESPSQATQKLILSGTVEDANIVFEETESELLQLAGICDSAELYPDIDPGKSVFRRSQLLDGVLYRDEMKPIFMHLSEHDQLVIGNAFMRKLSLRMDPNDAVLGRREVIRLIDAGASLSDYFEVDLLSLVRDSESAGRLSSKNPLLGRGAW